MFLPKRGAQVSIFRITLVLRSCAEDKPARSIGAKGNDVAVLKWVFRDLLPIYIHTATLTAVFKITAIFEADCCSASRDMNTRDLQVVNATTSDQKGRFTDADGTNRH